MSDTLPLLNMALVVTAWLEGLWGASAAALLFVGPGSEPVASVVAIITFACGVAVAFVFIGRTLDWAVGMPEV